MRIPALAAAVLAGLATAHAQAQQAPTPSMAPSTQKIAPHEKNMHNTSMRSHTVQSRYSFQDTLSRLQTAVQAKGMKVFALVDHQAAAKEIGLQMQPATVLIFGTPKAGTPLMVKDPAFALQLPLRVLVTEVNGQVQVVFNDTHALIDGSQIVYADVANNLANAETLIRKTVSE